LNPHAIKRAVAGKTPWQRQKTRGLPEFYYPEVVSRSVQACFPAAFRTAEVLLPAPERWRCIRAVCGAVNPESKNVSRGRRGRIGQAPEGQLWRSPAAGSLRRRSTGTANYRDFLPNSLGHTLLPQSCHRAAPRFEDVRV